MDHSPPYSETSLSNARGEEDEGSERRGAGSPDIDGPEVLPLAASPLSSSSSSSLHSDGSAIDVCADEALANGHGSEREIPSVACSAVAGGRLRFFLAGRCVLELAHDTDGDGRPKQWMQTSSKNYYSRPATWIPSTVVRERRERKISPCSGTPDATALQRKKLCYNGSFFPFAMLRRSKSSHFSRNYEISRVWLHRAARSPLRPIDATNLGDRTDAKTIVSTVRCGSTRKRMTFADRAERLFRVIECLPRCVSVSPVDDLDCDFVQPTAPGCKLPVSNDVSGGCQSTETSRKGTGDAFLVSLQELPLGSRKSEQLGANSRKWSVDDVPPPTSSPHLDDTPPNTPKKQKRDVCGSSADESVVGHFPTAPSVSPSAVDPCDERYLGPSERTEYPRTSQPRLALGGCRPPASSSPCSVLPAEARTVLNRCAQKKRKRGAYGRGRTIGEAVRNFVIRDILNLGGDLRTKCVPRGVFTEVGLRYKVDATTTYRWWLKYCNSLRSGDASSAATTVESSHYVGHNDAVALETLPRPFVKTVTNSSRSVDVHRRVADNCEMPGALRKERSSDVSFRDAPAADSHSPQSNDSQSSSTSIADPASLYASFVHANIWPQHFPLPPPPPSPHPVAAVNGSRSLSARLPPLPVGVCFPYVWNLPRTTPTTPNCLNRLQGCPTSPVNEKAGCESADEPLDLTLPKKCAKSDDFVISGHYSTRTFGLQKHPSSSPNPYSECGRLESSVLKTSLVDDRRVDEARSLLPSTSSSISNPHHNMKPKHYPFLSLQIGTFEIHSKRVSREREAPNKFKVIFTKRKFVYEFETTEGRREEEATSGSRQMACIVVPFNIVEAFWCCDTTIVFRVASKPLMFVGHRQKQEGCVPSLTVYETKRSVDLTGGQLELAHLHKVTLLKPQFVERLKIYLVLFDIRFRNIMTTTMTDLTLPVSGHLQDGDDAE